MARSSHRLPTLPTPPSIHQFKLRKVLLSHPDKTIWANLSSWRERARIAIDYFSHHNSKTFPIIISHNGQIFKNKQKILKAYKVFKKIG